MKGLFEMGQQCKDINKVSEKIMKLSTGRKFQAERTTSAKALRGENSWLIYEKVRRAVWSQ